MPCDTIFVQLPQSLGGQPEVEVPTDVVQAQVL